MPGPTFLVGSLTYVADLNTLSNAILTMSAQTANFNAVRAFWYVLKNNALTITMPPSPAAGDLMRLTPSGSAVTSVTISRNGNNIDSVASDVTLSSTPTERGLNVWLLFVDASIGWRIIQSPATGGLNYGGTQTGNFTAAKNSAYLLDNTLACTATMPTAPNVGDQVRLTAGQQGRTNVTIGRNGSLISGAGADVVISAIGWDVLLTYTGGTYGWVLVWSTTQSPAPTFDVGLFELRYWDTQRLRSDDLGWVPFAYPLGIGQADNFAGTVSLAASGGSMAVPMHVASHMFLDGMTLMNQDSASLHTLEWRLYKQPLNNGNAGEGTVNEVAGANGTFSYTPVGGLSKHNSTASGAPVYLPPGLYWLVLRNTSASVAAGIGSISNAGGSLNGKGLATKAGFAALASTADLVTGWTVQASQAGLKLNGRVLGQTSATYT